MKFQNPKLNFERMNVQTKARTDGQAQRNMSLQIFSDLHKNKLKMHVM